MLITYAIAILVSAALLFLVQPMVAKLVLPLMGGSPAVWTTCMLFFQLLLLAGYGYSHLLTKLSLKKQVLVHGLVLTAAITSLPISLPPAHAADPIAAPFASWPMVQLSVWLLAMLSMTVAAPFFVVSTTGPLLQRWFSLTGHSRAADPYFLYAASNAGSIVGLVAYPALVEPLLPLSRQGSAWAIGYAVFGLFAAACAVIMMGAVRRRAPATAEPSAPNKPTSPQIGWKRRAWWIALAAIPSSLMLGVTQAISTDVASIPLLWVLPLLLYLLTFIAAFSPRVKLPVRTLGSIIIGLALFIGYIKASGMTQPLWFILLAHLACFFGAAMLCHRRLADDRPPADRLTEFYLWLAVGGAVGGLFNGLLAPNAFNDVYEYPIALAAACLARPARGWPTWLARVQLKRVACVVAVVLIFGGVIVGSYLNIDTGARQRAGDSAVDWTAHSLRIGLPALVAFVLIGVRWVPALAVLASVGGITMFPSLGPQTMLTRGRSFFGVHYVYLTAGGNWHRLVHGTTLHGVQALKAPLRYKPTTYYAPSGPLGQVFELYGDDPRLKSVAVIGLGTGTIAAYGQPGDHFTFYEIDRSISEVATNPDYFTYLTDCEASTEIRLGDGRQAIAQAPDKSYGLIVVDAFSSDAIPVHLMTVEAIELYFSKLRDDGLVMFHISNRHFKLEDVLAAISYKMRAYALYNPDDKLTDELRAEGKIISSWAVFAKNPEALEPLVKDPEGRWFRRRWDKKTEPWTDDFSFVLGALRKP